MGLRGRRRQEGEGKTGEGHVKGHAKGQKGGRWIPGEITKEGKEGAKGEKRVKINIDKQAADSTGKLRTTGGDTFNVLVSGEKGDKLYGVVTDNKDGMNCFSLLLSF